MTRVIYSTFTESTPGTTSPALTAEEIEEINASIAGLVDDGILSSYEKRTYFVAKMIELDQLAVSLIARATASEISTTAIVASKNTHDTYLSTLSPAWDDLLFDTEVNRTILLANIEDFTQQIANLQAVLYSTIIIPKGIYSPTTTYNPGDAVTYLGNGYIRIGSGPTTGIDPTNTTFWKIYVNKGDSGLAFLLTNESHIVSADTDGGSYSLVGAGGAFKVFDGFTEVTSSGVTYSVVAPTTKNGLTMSINSSTGIYSLSGTEWTSDSETFLLRAVYSGITVDLVYSITKAKSGSIGQDAKTLTLISDRQTIAYNAAGLPTPSVQTTTFTVNKQNTTEPVTWSITDASGTPMTPASSYLSAVSEGIVTMTESQFNSARNGTAGVIVTASITDGVTFSDKISVVRVQEGATGSPGTPAVTGYLTNENFSLFAFANGNVVSYSGATGNFVVFQGSTNVSTSFSLSTLSNPQALTVNYSGQTYTVTGGMDNNEDTATLTIRATGTVSPFIGVTIDKIFTLVKAKGGYEIVSTLPTTNLFEGRMVFLTTDDKLYRYTGSAWTAAVPAVDITGQLADAQIAALAASKVTGQLSNAQIADLAAAKLTGQITQTQITDNSISTSKLAATAVTADKIASSAIVADKIASNAVTAVKIQAGAIETAKIAAGAVTAGELAAGSVIAGKIAANAVTATNIASNSIIADKIAAGAVTAAKIGVTELTAITANIGEATAGVLRNFGNTTRIDLNAGRIIFDNGTYLKASGVGFGTSNQFIEWFGVRPSGGNLALCSEANAIQYLKTNGDAYFGGSLSAGLLRNAATATGLLSTETIELGPFGSNGDTRVVVVSYTYSEYLEIINAASWSGTPSAALILERWNGSSWTSLTTFSATGSVFGVDGFSESERGYISIGMSGSTTFTDTSGGTSIRYRARLTSRTLPTVTSTISSGGPYIPEQQLGIISTEE